VDVETPVGTSLKGTDAVAGQAESIIAKIPDVENIFTTVGSIQSGSRQGESGDNYGQLTISLTEKESVLDRFLRPFTRGHKRSTADQTIAQEMRRKLDVISGGRLLVETGSGLGDSLSAIDIELMGNDMSELNRVAQKIKGVVASTEGVINPDVSWKVGKPEVKATIDRERAAQLGISVGEIAGRCGLPSMGTRTPISERTARNMISGFGWRSLIGTTCRM